MCAGLAPDVFDLDDEDYLHIAAGEVPAASADAVRHAVASCPTAGAQPGRLNEPGQLSRPA